MNTQVIECAVNFLSYERALGLVPPEFAYAYDWFQKHEGETIPRLPMGEAAPHLPVNIKLSSQRGMHSPNYTELASKGAGKRKYILSAYSASHGSVGNALQSVAYSDDSLVYHEDGTWTISYSSQRAMPGKKLTDQSNVYMMNNLIDGVPVAFMLKNETGYRVCGLAYVEQYNELTGMFTLHGPVSAEQEGKRFYSELAADQLTDEELAILEKADQSDNVAFVEAQVMRRKHQDRFRRDLIVAYNGRCAITGSRTLDVLQAAHIDAFARSRSHAVTNGLLLRADIHLLYDAHLLTVLPKSGKIRVSQSITDSNYRQLDQATLTFPDDQRLRPNDDLLEVHARTFMNQQCL